MRNFIKYTALITVALTALALSTPGEARQKNTKPGKKGKTENVAPAPKAEKKSEYDKFVGKKGVRKFPGNDVNLYQDEKDNIWVEFPKSLIGRDFLLKSYTKGSEDITKSDGEDISVDEVFTLGKRADNLILNINNSSVHAYDAEDEGIRAAIEAGASSSTAYTFPIKYSKSDSSSFIVNMTKFFEPSKKNCSLNGMDQGDVSIVGAMYEKEKSVAPKAVNFESSFGTFREASFKCAIQVGPFLANGKPYNCNIQTTLTLLPEWKGAPHKRADSRIGTYNINHKKFSDTGKHIDEKWAVRWDLSEDKKIKVYIDTLFSPVFYKAIDEGLKAWNAAFVEAGMGERIETAPFDKDMNADSPLVSTVKYSGGMGRTVRSSLQYNKRSEALSLKITVPGYFHEYVKRNATFTIGDVDTRYAGFDFTEDAIADVLRAAIIQQTGTGLGIARNLAGSYAYSPEQLRDPEFTSKNGFTASATDGVLFNYIAQPGDKERGVNIILDKIGEYDKYAIKWLYANGGIDNAREHRYIGVNQRGVPDPRGISEDLSNDPIAAYEAAVGHNKYAFANADKWLESENATEQYRELYIEYLWLKHYYTTYMLTKQIGGVSGWELRQGSGKPKYELIPEDVQRKCLEKVLNVTEEMSYMNTNRKLQDISGLSRDLTGYTRMNRTRIIELASRLPAVIACEKLAGSTYTADEYMTDVLNGVFANLKEGKYEPNDDMGVLDFFTFMKHFSPVMKENLKRAQNGGYAVAGQDTEDEFTTEFKASLLSGIPAEFLDDAELYAYNYSQKALDILKSGKSKCKDSSTASKFDYLISYVEAMLGKYNK